MHFQQTKLYETTPSPNFSLLYVDKANTMHERRFYSSWFKFHENDSFTQDVSTVTEADFQIVNWIQIVSKSELSGFWRNFSFLVARVLRTNPSGVAVRSSECSVASCEFDSTLGAVHSDFHPFEDNKMGTKLVWELNTES